MEIVRGSSLFPISLVFPYIALSLVFVIVFNFFFKIVQFLTKEIKLKKHLPTFCFPCAVGTS